MQFQAKGKGPHHGGALGRSKWLLPELTAVTPLHSPSQHSLICACTKSGRDLEAFDVTAAHAFAQHVSLPVLHHDAYPTQPDTTLVLVHHAVLPFAQQLALGWF